MASKPKIQTLKPRLSNIVDRVSVTRPGLRNADATGGGQGLYTYKWKQASKRFLQDHPLCQCIECDGGRKQVTAATVVDHIIPHRGDPVRFWDKANWQAMAKACHDRKTATEDGGFGNASAR